MIGPLADVAPFTFNKESFISQRRFSLIWTKYVARLRGAALSGLIHNFILFRVLTVLTEYIIDIYTNMTSNYACFSFMPTVISTNETNLGKFIYKFKTNACNDCYDRL